MPYTVEELTFEATSRTAVVDGHEIHYHDAGSGTPLVLLHGGGPGASGWSNFHQNLAGLSKAFRVLVVDQPGYGLSTKTPPVDECRSEMAMRLLVGLLDELGIARAHILGNSFGGRTALQTALHHPDRVLFGITKNGLVPPYAPKDYESDMPAFGEKLSDEEIWSVLAFIKSHWTSRDVLAARAEMTRNAGKRQ